MNTISMLTLPGTRIDDNSLDTLKLVRDLVYFDGPLVSLYNNECGEPYVFYWCDRDKKCNRWLVTRVDPQILEGYLNQTVDALSIMTGSPDGFVYFVDLDNDLSVHPVHLCPTELIPNEYKPEAGAMFDPDLALP